MDGQTAPIRRRLLAIYEQLLQACGVLAALGLLTIPVVIAADVFARHIFGTNLPWVADVSEYILYIATMISAPWLLHLGRHVRIDVLPEMLSPQARRVLEQVTTALVLLVCCVLVFYGISALQGAVRFDSQFYKSFTVPVWPFIAVFITSMTMICLELIVRLITGEHDRGAQSGL